MRNWRDKKPEDFAVRNRTSETIGDKPVSVGTHPYAQFAAFGIAILVGAGGTFFFSRGEPVNEPELAQQVLELSRQVDALAANTKRLRSFVADVAGECDALIGTKTGLTSKQDFCKALQPRYRDALSE